MTGLDILDSIRHWPPHVVFSDSPLSYLAESYGGQAYRYHVGMSSQETVSDPNTIEYQVIEPGGRLIGNVICSDTFGVDIILDNYINKAPESDRGEE